MKVSNRQVISRFQERQPLERNAKVPNEIVPVVGAVFSQALLYKFLFPDDSQAEKERRERLEKSIAELMPKGTSGCSNCGYKP